MIHHHDYLGHEDLFCTVLLCILGFPGGSDGKALPSVREARVQSLGWEDPLEKENATHLVFLPGKSHGQRTLVGYSLWGLKESDTTE